MKTLWQMLEESPDDPALRECINALDTELQLTDRGRLIRAGFDKKLFEPFPPRRRRPRKR